jgi:hypothetical protein
MCERGARNQNLISRLVSAVAGIENHHLFHWGGVPCDRALHHRDPSVAASRQLASQAKLKSALCEWRGCGTH